MKADFQEILSTDKERIEAYLAQCFTEDVPQKTLYEAMRYSLLAGGKRLRPLLTFRFCALCGGDTALALPFAAAAEMVHTYSLIHDDLPCMDDDDYRRGKLTNHKVYGQAQAVLAGDALLTAAFSQLTQAALAPQQITAAVKLLATCAGEQGMVGGQTLDMQAENRTCTEQEVLEIQSRKTGALIRAACCLGVIAAGGNEQQLVAATHYAEKIGLAFQIQDDILDAVGDAETLGKAVGMDANKNTFVRLYGIEACHKRVEAETREAISALSVFEDASLLKSLALSLVNRSA